MHLFYLILSFLIHKNYGASIDYLSFPDDLSIGTAISSFQTEGAWNIDGKSESIWDRFLHSKNKQNINVAIDFYHKYKEDIKILHELGVNHFRFAFSWSRLLPTGYVESANKKGIKFYHDFLDELEKYNITPVATIYHFDHPQSLMEFGGWLNESMAYVFADYARFVYEEFGSRIKTFTTINEILITCQLGYESNIFPPGIIIDGVGKYICAQNMLKGHAMAYHIYDKEYRSKYKGEVGIVDVCNGYYNEDSNDAEAEKIAHAFDCGLIFHPIFSEKGNFPDIVIRNVAERSKIEGRNSSRLPPLTDEWVKKIRGSSDYLGLNHYTSRLAKTVPRSEMKNWKNDSGVIEIIDPTWQESEIPIFPVIADGMGNVLRRIKNNYNNPKVYILENGIALKGELDDKQRIEFIYSFMKEILIAINRDKCNVKMFTYWSFLDSFENVCGENLRCQFGLISVDFDNKNLMRIMRKSSLWLQSVMKNRKLLLPSSASE